MSGGMVMPAHSAAMSSFVCMPLLAKYHYANTGSGSHSSLTMLSGLPAAVTNCCTAGQQFDCRQNVPSQLYYGEQRDNFQVLTLYLRAVLLGARYAC